MSITTSSQIARYFDIYKDVEITFTKEVIRATMLNTKQVFLKLQGYQWPCIVYSSSLTRAKIIANITPTLKKAIQDSKGSVSIRFSFVLKEKRDPISFFVPCKVAGFTPYRGDNTNLHFINVTFTQRPPNDLIEILGRVQEANSAAHNRKDERVIITSDNVGALGLASKAGLLLVDGVPRKCILRDISFGGSKLILMGVANFLVNKKAVLRLAFNDPAEAMDIPGTILRFEPVQGRDDLAAFAVLFDQDAAPMRFKMRLSNYFQHRSRHQGTKTSNKKGEQNQDEQNGSDDTNKAQENQ